MRWKTLPILAMLIAGMASAQPAGPGEEYRLTFDGNINHEVLRTSVFNNNPEVERLDGPLLQKDAASIREVFEVSSSDDQVQVGGNSLVDTPAVNYTEVPITSSDYDSAGFTPPDEPAKARINLYVRGEKYTSNEPVFSYDFAAKYPPDGAAQILDDVTSYVETDEYVYFVAACRITQEEAVLVVDLFDTVERSEQVGDLEREAWLGGPSDFGNTVKERCAIVNGEADWLDEYRIIMDGRSRQEFMYGFDSFGQESYPTYEKFRRLEIVDGGEVVETASGTISMNDSIPGKDIPVVSFQGREFALDRRDASRLAGEYFLNYSYDGNDPDSFSIQRGSSTLLPKLKRYSNPSSKNMEVQGRTSLSIPRQFDTETESVNFELTKSGRIKEYAYSEDFISENYVLSSEKGQLSIGRSKACDDTFSTQNLGPAIAVVTLDNCVKHQIYDDSSKSSVDYHKDGEFTVFDKNRLDLSSVGSTTSYSEGSKTLELLEGIETSDYEIYYIGNRRFYFERKSLPQSVTEDFARIPNSGQFQVRNGQEIKFGGVADLGVPSPGADVQVTGRRDRKVLSLESVSDDSVTISVRDSPSGGDEEESNSDSDSSDDQQSGSDPDSRDDSSGEAPPLNPDSVNLGEKFVITSLSMPIEVGIEDHSPINFTSNAETRQGTFIRFKHQSIYTTGNVDEGSNSGSWMPGLLVHFCKDEYWDAQGDWNYTLVVTEKGASTSKACSGELSDVSGTYSEGEFVILSEGESVNIGDRRYGLDFVNPAGAGITVGGNPVSLNHYFEPSQTPSGSENYVYSCGPVDITQANRLNFTAISGEERNPLNTCGINLDSRRSSDYSGYDMKQYELGKPVNLSEEEGLLFGENSATYLSEIRVLDEERGIIDGAGYTEWVPNYENRVQSWSVPTTGSSSESWFAAGRILTGTCSANSGEIRLVMEKASVVESSSKQWPEAWCSGEVAGTEPGDEETSGEEEQNREDSPDEISLTAIPTNVEPGNEISIEVLVPQKVAEAGYSVRIENPSGETVEKRSLSSSETSFAYELSETAETGNYMVEMDLGSGDGIISGLESFIDQLLGKSKPTTSFRVVRGGSRWKSYCSENHPGYTGSVGSMISCMEETIISDCFEENPGETCTQVADDLCKDVLGLEFDPSRGVCYNPEESG